MVVAKKMKGEDNMKDISENYIQKMDLAPYKAEFKETGKLSSETVESIMGRQPNLGFNSPDMDTNIMEFEDFTRWVRCKEILIDRLRKEA